MVEGLKPYTIMKIQVEYADTDLFKSKYNANWIIIPSW